MKFKKGDIVKFVNQTSILYGTIGTVVKTVGIKVYVSHGYYPELTQYKPFHERDLMLITKDDNTSKVCNGYTRREKEPFNHVPEIRNVYFNDPLTIVIWKDGTKTFVKNTDGDHNYDPEKALAMAIAKKALGNKYKYYKVFEKWLPEEKAKTSRKSLSSFKMASKECIDGRMGLTENPIEKAYLMLLKIKDDPSSMDVDSVIGYLGEALDS